jgi:hypothetical protein
MGEALAGPLEMLASMVAGVTQFSGIITAVIGSFVIFKGIQLSILGIQKISAAYEAIKTFNAGRQLALSGAYNASAAARQVILQGELAKSIGIAAAWAIANPFYALAGLAIAAGVGALVYSQMKDGVIDPKKGPIVSGEFGTVQLHPRDQIVAGTDLIGNSRATRNKQPQSSTSMPPSTDIFARMESVLHKILAKEGTVKMDGNKVGQAHNIGAVKVQ